MKIKVSLLDVMNFVDKENTMKMNWKLNQVYKYSDHPELNRDWRGRIFKVTKIHSVGTDTCTMDIYWFDTKKHFYRGSFYKLNRYSTPMGNADFFRKEV